ncbi:hypothetical protein BAE44_0021471, partial [Dichanthelium oligosanthes]
LDPQEVEEESRLTVADIMAHIQSLQGCHPTQAQGGGNGGQNSTELANSGEHSRENNDTATDMVSDIAANEYY